MENCEVRVDNQPTVKELQPPKEPVQQIVPSSLDINMGATAESDELSVKDKAVIFIGKVLSTLVELKTEYGDDEMMKKILDNIGLCVSKSYTCKEIEAHMLAAHGTPAEAVRQLYDAIVVGTGDPSGGEAYEKHSIDCARLRREKDAKEAEDAYEERRLSVRRVSTSGSK